MPIVKYGSNDDASEIKYDNKFTGLNVDNLQDAIDLLYEIKEPVSSTILKNSNIGVTVQAYNSNLTSINQELTTTSEVTFKNVGISNGITIGSYSLPITDGVLVSSGAVIPQVLQTNGAGVVSWKDKVDQGWNDLTAELTVRGNASSAPVWEQIGTLVGINGYNFTINKECWAAFHIPHDYKPGGEIYIHVHWTSDGVDRRNVKWKIDYTVAKGHNQSIGGNFPLPETIYLEQSCSGTAYRHMVTEMANSINISNAEVDSLILVHLKRVTNGATDNTDNVYGLTIDCHYQCDRFSTPNRAPNFYGV